VVVAFVSVHSQQASCHSEKYYILPVSLNGLLKFAIPDTSHVQWCRKPAEYFSSITCS
jgi:hypothetical protein